MDGFIKLPKMQHFKEGGSVKKEIANYEKRERKTEEKADIAQDKAIVKKAIRMHDIQEHKGEKTDLSKLKKGGRAKKECGTVKKYCGGKKVAAYEGGGSVIDTIKDQATDLKNKIIGTPEQNRIAQANLDKQAAQGSKLAKMLGGQGSVSNAERETVTKTINKKSGRKVC